MERRQTGSGDRRGCRYRSGETRSHATAPSADDDHAPDMAPLSLAGEDRLTGSDHDACSSFCRPVNFLSFCIVYLPFPLASLVVLCIIQIEEVFLLLSPYLENIMKTKAIILSGTCPLSRSLAMLGFGRYSSLSSSWVLPLFEPGAILLVQRACETARNQGFIPVVSRPFSRFGWSLSFLPAPPSPAPRSAPRSIPSLQDISKSACCFGASAVHCRSSEKALYGWVLAVGFRQRAIASRFAKKWSQLLPYRCGGCHVRFLVGFWFVSIPITEESIPCALVYGKDCDLYACGSPPKVRSEIANSGDWN